MLTLASPLWLLLLPLPWLLRPRNRQSGAALPRLPLDVWYRKIPGISQQQGRPSWWRSLLLVLAWIALLTALTRPQIIDETVTQPESGRDLMLVIDLSPSMEERDMLIGNRAITRLEAVKRLGADFIHRREGDRIGLTVFSTTAHLYAPLTFDTGTVARFLDESFVGMAGNATAIGDALGLAIRNLKEQSTGEPVIILLTDGENNAGNITPEMAAEVAEAEGIRIHAIGVGSPDDGRHYGGWRGLRRPAGVDEALLQSIASRTGGEFFMARSMPDLELIYHQLDGLEPIEHDTLTYVTTRELYYWPLALALASMLLSRMTLPALTAAGQRDPLTASGGTHD